MEAAQRLHVQTEARGAIPASAVELAVRKVHSLLRLAPEPVLFARVTLTMAADPAVKRPATAQADLDLNGRIIRARAVGSTTREAVARMCDRLRIRLDRAGRNWAAIRGGKTSRRQRVTWDALATTGLQSRPRTDTSAP